MKVTEYLNQTHTKEETADQLEDLVLKPPEISETPQMHKRSSQGKKIEIEQTPSPQKFQYSNTKDPRAPNESNRISKNLLLIEQNERTPINHKYRNGPI